MSSSCPGLFYPQYTLHGGWVGPRVYVSDDEEKKFVPLPEVKPGS